MSPGDPGADARRICPVLDGIAFPAANWQLIMYAEEYGADARSRCELWAMTDGQYPDLRSVLTALGLVNRGPVNRGLANVDLTAAHGAGSPVAG